MLRSTSTSSASSVTASTMGYWGGGTIPWWWGGGGTRNVQRAHIYIYIYTSMAYKDNKWDNQHLIGKLKWQAEYLEFSSSVLQVH